MIHMPLGMLSVEGVLHPFIFTFKSGSSTSLFFGQDARKPREVKSGLHNQHPGIPNFFMLCLVALHRYCVCVCVCLFFYKLEVCDKAALNKFIGAILTTMFTNFVSRCHILVILTIFQPF